MTKENQIEQQLIEQLKGLKYIYRPDIVDRKTLEQNFKTKFEELNRVRLSDSEFLRLREEIITNDIFEASTKLRERQYFQREDGTPLHYTLVNIKDWCKNEYEVINQLRINTENSHQRYDVILLINGLPIVQIELKKLDVSPRKAMQQIVDYKNESGNGYSNTLLCFMQLFIVSNNTNTFYFANNAKQHFQFNADEQFLPIYHLADKENNKIKHLKDFTDTFLKKCTLGEMISKYMVLVKSEHKILVMRPYQIYAVKAIEECVKQNRGNGYIWHTTGSGKTLTSFKTSTLLKDNPDIDKCLFVVDRKDLDRQTREEFNKFQEGSVEENTNTEVLVRRLLSTDYADKVIFGFTGTPIFEENASYKIREDKYASYKTTKDVFEKELHYYTISEAIDDSNVLKFHLDFFKGEGNINTKIGETITQQAVVEAILKKHNSATNSRKFNAILATSSINNAIEYYQLFKKIQKKEQQENTDFKPLNIACVFSPPAQLVSKEGDRQSQKNVADIKQLQEDLIQEKEDNKHNPEQKKEALIEIINDYNQQYKTNHSINEFDLYYQDVQRRIKDQKYSNKDVPHSEKIDITIVVDMLLTGFDSKYLNTLYVDKNLKYHGLIQAFSRTNRVLNDTKPYGNILDFRLQQDNVNEAIALFSRKDGKKAKEIWLIEPAPIMIDKYKEAVQKLGAFMKEQNLVNEPQEVYNLKGDLARIAFVKNFKEVQRLKTQLDQYTDLNEEQVKQIETILPSETLLEFRSSYLETAKQLQEIQQKEGDNASDEIQQLDFEFVLFSSAVIDYDYIMELTAENLGKKPSKHKMTKEQIKSLLKSNSNLMEEEKDLTAYIDSLDWGKGQDLEELKKGYDIFKDNKYNKEIASIAQKNNLDTGVLKSFVENIINRMIFDGEKLTDLLEPLDLGWKERRNKELELMKDLVPQLKKLAQGREISGLSAYEQK